MAFFSKDAAIDWSIVDAIEVHRLTRFEDFSEPCFDLHNRDVYFGIFVHYKDRGVDCIAELPRLGSALRYARKLTEARGLELKDFTYTKDRPWIVRAWRTILNYFHRRYRQVTSR